MSHGIPPTILSISVCVVLRGVEHHPDVKKPPYDIPAVCDAGDPLKKNSRGEIGIMSVQTVPNKES